MGEEGVKKLIVKDASAANNSRLRKKVKTEVGVCLRKSKLQFLVI